MAKNMVIAGDYQGKAISLSFGLASIAISLRPYELLELNKALVESYEVITEETQKSAASGVARGIIGGALLGPVGMLAGGLSAKNKGTVTIAVLFKDGKRSLLEVDDKIYKAIVQHMF